MGLGQQDRARGSRDWPRGAGTGSEEVVRLGRSWELCQELMDVQSFMAKYGKTLNCVLYV
jgi:hypothetical protein